MRSDLPSSTTVRAGGLNHAVKVWEGDPSRTLFAVHGYLDCGASFAAMVRHLPPDLRVVAPDMRGHGGSDRVSAGGYYHFFDYARDVRDLVDATVPESMVLLGHSMGGVISTLFAGSWPADVERLILVEGLGPPQEEAAAGPERLARWAKEVRDVFTKEPKSFDGPEDVAKRLRRSNPRLSEELADELAGDLAEVQPDGRWRWRHDPLHRTRTPALYDWARYRPFAEAITCPTLLVTGGKSWYRYRSLEKRRTALRNARRLHLEEAGHMVHHDAPKVLANAVVSFIDGRDPPGAEPVPSAVAGGA